MELRARIRPLSRRAAFAAALVAIVASAGSGALASDAHAKKKKIKAPVVTKVAPLDVAVGERLTIRGRNFIRGRNKNTVVFKRSGARAVFAKAQIGTKKMLAITVPDSLQEFLLVRSGKAVPTQFQLRVLSRTFAKKFTSLKRSPRISPPRDKPAGPPPESGDCDGDGVRNRDTADDDGDLLSDAEETRILSNPCIADTDLDGVEDGYEYRSALDLNDDEYQQPNQILAYPYKTPYPNPGFADANVDHDADTLTLKEEYDLWVYSYSVTKTDTRSLDALSYSDGEQYSRSQRLAGGSHNGRRVPTLLAAGYDKHTDFVNWTMVAGYRKVWLQDPASPLPWWNPAGRDEFGLFDVDRSGAESLTELGYNDLDGDLYLSDDERDEDADGLTNYDEAHGRMFAPYWASCYSEEKPYYIGYQGTNLANEDSDGDGVRDGADDQDHDDIPNVMELSRRAATGFLVWDGHPTKLCSPADGLDPENNHPNLYGRVNPLNPCLPLKNTRSCPDKVNSGMGAPFDGSPNWFVLN